MATNIEAGAVYKAHFKYNDDFPEWMELANRAINEWGRGEFTIQHAVAMALEDAYQRGVKGDYPVYHAPVVQKTFRRSHPAPEIVTYVPVQTVFRRNR